MQTLQQYATDAAGNVVPPGIVSAVETVASTAQVAAANKTISLAELLSVLVLVANAVLTTTKNK